MALPLKYETATNHAPIDAGLNDTDQGRIEAARGLLQDVSLLSHPEQGGDADTQGKSCRCCNAAFGWIVSESVYYLQKGAGNPVTVPFEVG